MSEFVGKGTLLKRYNGSTYDTIARVVNLDGPDAKNATVTTMHLGSTAVTRLGTIPDYGTVTFDLLFDPATSETTHAALWGDLGTGAVKQFQIVFSNTGNTVSSFSAIVAAFKPGNIAVDAVVTASLTLDISGTVTFA